MSQPCTHNPKLLRCGSQPCCKGCIQAYQTSTRRHIVESLRYPEFKEKQSIRVTMTTESPEEKFLRTLIEQEQVSTSEILEYLDVIQSMLIMYIEKKISIVKAEVAANSCKLNDHIQSLLAYKSNEDFRRIVAGLRAAETSTHQISIDEELFKDAVNDMIVIKNSQKDRPSIETEQFMVDFLDSRTMRWLTLGESVTKCQYKDIRGDFVLFPHCRYCFTDDEHTIDKEEGKEASLYIITTGGLENNFPIHNSYLVSATSPESSVLPPLLHPRSRHATCVFKTKSTAVVFVFGGSSSPAVEKLELTKKVFACLKDGAIFQIDGENGMQWERQRELPCSLETASCVQHSDFIYVTGSDPTANLRVVKYDPTKTDPQAPPDVIFDFLNKVVRYPCALCAWHTLVVVLFTDGRSHWAHRWTVGTPFSGKEACKELDVAGKRVEWAPVCPPVTKDSNCFILTETERGTVLVCYNFIRRKVSFPQMTLDSNYQS